MKKIFKISLTLMFLFSSIMVNVSAAAYATEGLVKQYVTEKKDTVEISIALQGPTAYINSISLYIPYDSTKLIYNSGTSNIITNDIISVWASKSITAAHSSYDGTDYIKIAYATDTSNYFMVNENQEVVLFTFQLHKLISNEKIGSVCPTTWGAVRVTPISYAYSAITTINNCADYSMKLVANPQLFTIIYTQYENIITSSIGANGIVKINATSVTDGSSTTIDDENAAIEVIPNDGYEVESATFDGIDMNIPKNGGTYEAAFTGTKALIVIFKSTENKITPTITGVGIVKINDVVIRKSSIEPVPMNIGSSNVYNSIILDDTGKAKIEIIPGYDYQVSVATLDGVNMGIPADGGYYNAVIDGEVNLAVTFVTISVDQEKPQTYKYMFSDNNVTYNGKTTKAKIAFAKRPLSLTGSIMIEYGVKLTDSDRNDIKTPDGTGPYFDATINSTASGQFGIQFIALPRLEDGKSYVATAYIRKDTGDYILGNSVSFIVE